MRIDTAPIPLAALIPGACIPPRRRPIMEFLAHEFRLPEAGEGNPGRLSFATRPYQPPILQCIDRHDIDEAVVVAFSQGGKSTLAVAMLAHWIINAPGNVMHVHPIEDSRDRFVAEKLAPCIYATPAWKRELIGGKRSLKRTRLRFAKAKVFQAVAQSEAQLASVTCRYVLADEVDKFPIRTRREGSPLDQARKRLRTQRRRGAKLVAVSTPTTASGLIWSEYLNSDRRSWTVPCPACGKYDRWSEKGLRWPEPQEIDEKKQSLRDVANLIRAGQAKAWYEFPCCGASIHTREAKLKCNLAGRFEPSRPTSRVAGFWVPSFASDDTSLEDLAAGYLYALHEQRFGNHDPMRMFRNHEMALPFYPPKAKTEEASVTNRVVQLSRGEVPPGFGVVTIGADLQHDRIYWIAIAWKPGEMLAAHVVDWGQIEGRPEDSLRLFAGLYGRAWKQGDGKLATAAAGIDSGDGTLTGLVYTACLRAGPRCFPVKGDSRQLHGGALIRKNEKQDEDHRGRLTLVCPVNVNDRVLSMSDGTAPAYPGESYGLTYAAEAAEDMELQRQLAAWARDDQGRWAKREGYDDDHYHDARRYSFAMAARLGLFRATAPAKPAPAQGQAPQPAHAPRGSYRHSARGYRRR